MLVDNVGELLLLDGSGVNHYHLRLAAAHSSERPLVSVFSQNFQNVSENFQNFS
jgi:hypothetical protein